MRRLGNCGGLCTLAGMRRFIVGAALLLAAGFGFIATAEESKPMPPMLVKVYRVPPGFVSEADPSDKAGKRKPLSGFNLIRDSHTVYDATDFLKSQGVTFPAGSQALYDQEHSYLVVINTTENLDLADVILNGEPPGVAAAVDIEISAIECSLPTSKPPPSPGQSSYVEFCKAAGNSMKLLDRVSVLGQSGQRCFVHHIIDPSSTGKAAVDTKKSSDSASSFALGESGSKVEVEPVIGPDLVTMDFSIVYRFRHKVENQVSDVEFTTSFAAWDDYPLVLHVSPVPNHEGKFVAVIARARIVNPGGWKLKDVQRESERSKSK